MQHDARRKTLCLRTGSDFEDVPERDKMSKLGDDLSHAMNDAIVHEKRERGVIVFEPIAPGDMRDQAHLTQVLMVPLMGLSLSTDQKLKQGQRRTRRRAASRLRMNQKELDAVKRAVL